MKTFPGCFLFLVLFSCTPAYKNFVTNYYFKNTDTIPDYARLEYWAAHPRKWDPSDSLPMILQSGKRDTILDVFFVHPTTYTGQKTASNAAINDAELNAKTDYSSILYQASAFNQHARLFAPRYRQAHLSAFFTNDSLAFEVAYNDVRNAFLYYLKHWNKRRPIVIAAHSQGALLSKWLLKEFFDGKPLQQQLLAAYIIGWPVFTSDFSSIKPCADSSETGCVISWRTYKNGYIPKYIQKEPPAFVTNPLTWKSDTIYAAKSLNKGSVLRPFTKIIANGCDALINGNVLWIHKPKFPGSFLYRSRNFHIADINLFYMNIRQNVETRMLNGLSTSIK